MYFSKGTSKGLAFGALAGADVAAGADAAFAGGTDGGSAPRAVTADKPSTSAAAG